MSSNVYLRVFGLKGITPRMVNNHPKGKVWCSADLGDTKLETVKNGIGGGSLAVNEVRVCLCGSRRVSFVFVLQSISSVFKFAANVLCYPFLCRLLFACSLFDMIPVARAGCLEHHGRVLKVGDEP